MTRRILNLGAGTQSSVLYLMMCRGEIPPAEVAIFADTQWEPGAVYEHLAWLEAEGAGRVPIVTVTAGNLRDDALDVRVSRKTGKKWSVGLPYWIKQPDGKLGLMGRQCTVDYKIEPINRYIKQTILGRPRRLPTAPVVVRVFGISYDERERMKVSRDPWATNEYPLVERRWTRDRVIAWARTEYPSRVFPRSACVGCPYHDQIEWAKVRDDPAQWADAVAFDRQIRAGHAEGSAFTGVPHLHRSGVPLELADLSPAKSDQGELFGMRNECEGMCGV